MLGWRSVYNETFRCDERQVIEEGREEKKIGIVTDYTRSSLTAMVAMEDSTEIPKSYNVSALSVIPDVSRYRVTCDDVIRFPYNFRT